MESRNKFEILNVRVDNFNKSEIIKKVEFFLTKEKFHQIATVNPEFILTAQKDEIFRNILNNCDLNVADGTGIKFAFWRHGEKLKERITGADLMWEIIETANKKNLKIFLAANNRGLSTWEETLEAIRKKYPNLEIIGANIDRNITDYRLLIADYDILLCNFGHPYQEKFINSVKNGKIRLAMGVGGAFDFVTGRVKKAPGWMRKFGLEWLYRLIQQPKRFRRIFRAVIIFPIKVIINK